MFQRLFITFLFPPNVIPSQSYTKTQDRTSVTLIMGNNISNDISIFDGSFMNDYPEIDMSHVVITHDVSTAIQDYQQPLTTTILMSKSFYKEHIRRCRAVVYQFACEDPGWPHSVESNFYHVRFALSWILGENVTNPNKTSKKYIYVKVRELYPHVCAGVFNVNRA